MATLLFALQAGYRSRTHLAFCRQVRCEVYFGCKHEIFFYALFCITYAVVSVQIYFFVFDALPKPFDKHIVTPATLAIYTDLDTVILQQPGEFQVGELATLVSSRPCKIHLTVAVALYTSKLRQYMVVLRGSG